jgi:carbonic anhydrase
MKQKFSLVIIAVVLTVIISCKETQKPKESHEGHKHNEEHVEHQGHKKDCSEVHWSHHKGEDGPENWKNLCDGFLDCGGNVQSPINIDTKNVVKAEKLLAPEFNYAVSKVAIINNGHTVQFNISGDNRVKLDNKSYKLLQFHYHTKSEHTVDGNYYPIEVHFVHQYADNDYAVLGVLFEEGVENELLKKYLPYFPTTKGIYNSEDTIDLNSLFPTDKSYYNYKGSLTTPPCSEVVNWYVLKTPLTASKEQIEQFSKILDNNYRPIQALNKRTVFSFGK